MKKAGKGRGAAGTPKQTTESKQQAGGPPKNKKNSTSSTSSTSSGRAAQAAPALDFPRHMREVPQGAQGPRRGLQQRVKVMTYNVLKASCSLSFYQHCDTQHMLFNYRLLNQSREIETLSPDVVCLQEVEKYQEYLSYLSKTYSGTYKKREKGDGCAVFYNRDRYYQGEVRELELGYDTVALLVQLMPLAENDGPLLIATTHLAVWFDDEESEAIRLNQTYELMRTIEAWRKEKEAELGQEELPIILCGDFNSTPESSIYTLLTSGRAPTATKSKGSRTSASTPQAISTSPGEELPSWQSAYAFHQTTLDGNLGEPPYTTLLPNSTGQVVDYILWPHASPMRLRSLLEIPAMPENAGLPNAIYSSDHFSLMCEFE